MSIKKNHPNSKAKNGKKKTYKFIKKGKGNEPTVIEFNLSKAVIILIAIVVVVATIATVKVISTIVGAKENNVLAGGEETNENVTWVESTHVDESGATVVDVDDEGNPIKIPVPKGYSASKIPGETSANSGFVIYEGDIDWSTILVDTTSTNSIDTQANTNTETNTNETTTQSSQENASNAITNNENISTDNAISENEEISTNGETTQTQSDATTQEQDTDMNSNNNAEQENVVNVENTISETENTENTENLNNDTANIENESTIESESIVENAEKDNLEENTNSESETVSGENDTESSDEKNITQENTEEIVEESSGIETQNTQIQDSQVQVLADDTTDTNAEPRATTEEINIFNLQKSANQFVWVPVKEPERIYGVDSNGKLWGKLYDYSSSGRTPLNWSETNGIMSIIDKTSYREPDVTRYNTNYDIDSILQSNLNGKNQYELLSKELEENFYLTIKSIKEYGGFYIGRYETGGLSGEAVVRKMEEDIHSQTWYTMYEKAKDLKGKNNTVMTFMLWGSLWDETMEWLVESGATISDGTTMAYDLIGFESKSWGNYPVSQTFYYIPSGSTTPDETAEKAEDIETIIPTGSSEYTKVNNIYDLAGNVAEWTLEEGSFFGRSTRGGYSGTYGIYRRGSACWRAATFPALTQGLMRPSTPNLSSDNSGLRVALFIK